MNFKYEQLPEPAKPKPYLKYHYRMPPERNPLVEIEQQTFEQVRNRQFNDRKRNKYGEVYQSLGDSTQMLAKDLIEENMVLKSKLASSQKRIQELEVQVRNCRTELSSLGKVKSRDNLVQFREEIVSMMEKNKIIEDELNLIRNLVPSHQTLEREQKQSRLRSNSLDAKRTRSRHQESIDGSRAWQCVEGTRGRQENRRVEELISSIKGMYLKIMGFRVESLKELWRWLKSMGSTYNNTKKWCLKAKATLSSGSVSPDKPSELLWEVLSILM